MKKRLFALCLMILALSAYSPALANAAEPPGLTVIVNDPPENLTLTLKFGSGESALLVPEHRFWEGQYRFFYGSIPGSKQLKNATLIVNWSDGAAEFPIPQEYLGYDNQVTLDLKTNELIQGQNPWRAPLLAAMRVILTLIIEGAIFFAFGYRTKQSIKLVLITNLISQTTLNIIFIGAEGYWFLMYILVEIVVFTLESLIYKDWLAEHGQKRAVLYALTANAASLILGGWMISSLPV